TSDENERKDIQKKINEVSLKAAEYAIPNEMDRLLSGIGSTGINAFTTEEMIAYHNTFPPNQMEKWLEIYSHRFKNPVFRLFQPELEIVYEEKNRSMDSFFFALYELYIKQFFKNHPYGQQTIIGKTEHLKNPSLNKMYEYYDTYYVANNMALVLCGDFDSESIMPMIEEKFSTLRTGEVPEYPEYPEQEFNGREYIKKRLSPIKIGLVGYRTVPNGHKDRAALKVCNYVLTNTGQTGLWDQLILDNEIMFATNIDLTYNDHGANLLIFIPKIIGQPLKKAEKLVLDEVAKLRNGDFDDWLLESAKRSLLKSYEMDFEGLYGKSQYIGQIFVQGSEWNDFTEYLKKLKAVTKKDVLEVANKYYGNNYLVLHSKMGFPKKEKIEKPGFEPAIPKKDAVSEFAKKFEKIPSQKPRANFVDFNKGVQELDINNLTHLYTTHNPKNDIFTLSLEFGIGNYHLPLLTYASQYLNLVGTQEYDIRELKLEFDKIGCTYIIESNDDKLSIQLEGYEDHLNRALELTNDLINNAKPDPKKVKNIVQAELQGRKLEKEPEPIGQALKEYVIFQDNSSYLRRRSRKGISQLNADSMIAVFKDALTYEVTIHYVGKNSNETVKNAITNSLNISVKNHSKSPVMIRKTQYDNRKIYFIDNKDALQSHISIYIPGKNYNIKEQPDIDAFNEYFGGGMSSLVFQEIREYRSLAYSAWGWYRTPKIPDDKGYFSGYIGCQADKTIEALDIMNSILTKMPLKIERLNTIKNALIQSAYTDRPHYRYLSSKVEAWKTKGYTDDPSKVKLSSYEALTFENIEKFYQSNIKGLPIVIGIVGDKSRIDLEKLAEYGEIIYLKESDVFNN
ncbi:MAG: insulinase family protein, partial [Bacteroidia bacterium]|nr:insulinase family protein [Bacteroidia bacterium]